MAIGTKSKPSGGCHNNDAALRNVLSDKLVIERLRVQRSRRFDGCFLADRNRRLH